MSMSMGERKKTSAPKSQGDVFRLGSLGQCQYQWASVRKQVRRRRKEFFGGPLSVSISMGECEKTSATKAQGDVIRLG